jgi:hypothetical protein
METSNNTADISLDMDKPKTTLFYEYFNQGVKARRASLHSSFQVPAGGGETEAMYDKPGPGLGRSALTGVLMSYHEMGLFCIYKNEQFVIPLANVKGVWL